MANPKVDRMIGVKNKPVASAVFPLLAEPGKYVACEHDLGSHPKKRAYWLALFRRHFPSLLEEYLAEAAERREAAAEAKRRAGEADREFIRYLDEVEREPECHGRLDILTVCHARERALRQAGIADPYRLAKRKQNEDAMKLLPALLMELDAMGEDERALQVVLGVFAGNIFDLGATKTVELFKHGGFDFRETLGKLSPRPWLVDDLDAWLKRMAGGRGYRKAVLFVDNAGPDILLGMIPFARELLVRGTGVVMTANTTPSLNDITHEELTGLIGQIAGWDGVIGSAVKEGKLVLVPSGNAAPLIDLSVVSQDLATAAGKGNHDVDLVVLEGMGRAIESNWNAAFTCDVLKAAMVKDQGVADSLSGKIYDLVFRFTQAG